MKRRSFWGTAVGTATLASGLMGCTEREKTRDRSIQPSEMPVTDNDKLAGMTLKELREQYRYELFDDFLPFVETYIVDHEYGGFMCNTDHDGTNITTNKRPYSLGRGLWLFSFLYNNFGKEEKYLTIARKAANFILKHKPSVNDLWPELISRDGTVLDAGDFSIARDFYVAEGFAEFGKATDDQMYMDLGKEILFKCLRYYDKPDYLDSASPYPGARNMWYWMLFMWYGIRMLHYHYDHEMEKLVDRCIDALLNYHHHPDFDLMNNIVNHDLSRAEDPKYSRLAACGHATEALWMILYEAVRKKDRALFDLASQRFKRHVKVSIDDVYGGVFNDLINVDENIWQLSKIHWAQEFVLMGSLPIIEHTGIQWAIDMFSEQFVYLWDKFPLRQYGYPMWISSGDRNVSFRLHTTRKEIYHHPRHLMLNLLSLDRMIERGGKTSGIFA